MFTLFRCHSGGTGILSQPVLDGSGTVPAARALPAPAPEVWDVDNASDGSGFDGKQRRIGTGIFRCVPVRIPVWRRSLIHTAPTSFISCVSPSILLHRQSHRHLRISKGPPAPAASPIPKASPNPRTRRFRSKSRRSRSNSGICSQLAVKFQS